MRSGKVDCLFDGVFCLCVMVKLTVIRMDCLLCDIGSRLLVCCLCIMGKPVAYVIRLTVCV